jgi:uncharacterized protein YPO0396
MNRELIKDYLQRAEMSEVQAEALSRILAEMATKNDLQLLEERVDKRFSVLEGQMALLRTELTGQMSQLRSDLTGEMAQMRADLTWRIVALIVLFGTVITIINTFVG